jgi:two-component system, OmpR family, response regulator ResD
MWSSTLRPDAASGAAVRARVLVVEDEPTLREVIAAYLEDAGYTVDQAETGVQALDKMRQTRPDVVVLDLLLPIMNAYELVPRMRSQPALAAIPVILFSAAQDLPNATEQLQPRASLAKPVDLDVLLAVVARVASS